MWRRHRARHRTRRSSQLVGHRQHHSAAKSPRAATPADALASASSVLSVLKPNVVVDQVLNVATGVTALDIPGILHNLTCSRRRSPPLDARGAHQIAGELNNQFAPLVKMAAAVDLKWVSQILSVIPDPSGYTQIAALVDVASWATSTSSGWPTSPVKPRKSPGPPWRNSSPRPGSYPTRSVPGPQTAALLPLGLDLASVAVNMLTGKATKTDPGAARQTDQSRGRPRSPPRRRTSTCRTRPGRCRPWRSRRVPRTSPRWSARA